MIEFEMDGIPTVGNTILGLEFVCSFTNDFGDFVRTFPGRTELADSWVFGILEDSAWHPVSSLEFPRSKVLVVVPCYLLMVSYSLETSLVSQLINGVEIVIKLLLLVSSSSHWYLRDWIPVSIGMTASEPYAKADGVSPVGVRVVVR